MSTTQRNISSPSRFLSQTVTLLSVPLSISLSSSLLSSDYGYFNHAVLTCQLSLNNTTNNSNINSNSTQEEGTRLCLGQYDKHTELWRCIDDNNSITTVTSKNSLGNQITATLSTDFQGGLIGFVKIDQKNVTLSDDNSSGTHSSIYLSI